MKQLSNLNKKNVEIKAGKRKFYQQKAKKCSTKQKKEYFFVPKKPSAHFVLSLKIYTLVQKTFNRLIKTACIKFSLTSKNFVLFLFLGKKLLILLFDKKIFSNITLKALIIRRR